LTSHLLNEYDDDDDDDDDVKRFHPYLADRDIFTPLIGG